MKRNERLRFKAAVKREVLEGMFAQEQEQRKVKCEKKRIRKGMIKSGRKPNNSETDHFLPSSDGDIIKGISKWLSLCSSCLAYLNVFSFIPSDYS